MAKQHGFLKVQGKLDEISFYKRKDEYLLRNKGGVSKERIMNDPRFKRTRENGNEFGSVAHSGKIFRKALSSMIGKAYDGTLTQRLVAALSEVRNCDVTSERGYRTVANGLGTLKGVAVMKGFEFNSRSSLDGLLRAEYSVDTANGEVTIQNLIPADAINAPQYATHVSFRAGFLDIDFESEAGTMTYSPYVVLPLDMTVSSPTLTPTAVPAGTGIKMYFLLIEFYQERNGVQYVLSNGDFNSLTLLDLV